MVEGKVTSIRIDEDLWREARIRCLNENLQVSNVVAELLREWLGKK